MVDAGQTLPETRPSHPAASEEVISNIPGHCKGSQSLKIYQEKSTLKAENKSIMKGNMWPKRKARKGVKKG